jgi:hypothetical protein
MNRLKDGKENSASKSQPKIERQVLVDPRDLEVILRAGCVIMGRLKDLIHLRDEEIGKDPRFQVRYWRNASIPVYIVTEDDYLLLKKIKEGLEH